MAVDADGLAPKLPWTLEGGAKARGYALGRGILISDVTDGCDPTELAIGKVPGAQRGLRRVAATVEVLGEAPADFPLRPALRVPGAAPTGPLRAGLVLQRP